MKLVFAVEFPVGMAVDEGYDKLVSPVPEPEAEGRTPVLAPAVSVAVVAFDNGNGGVLLGVAKDRLFTCVPADDDGDAPVGPTEDVRFVRG